MSAICGIINFDGEPADPAALAKMARSIAYRGPDGIHLWNGANAALAHLALNVTPEAAREKQPVIQHTGRLALVADARIDNREELIHTLTLKGCLQDREVGDAGLILAAYACWGRECVQRLCGDFAFAIWDAPEQQLFCARDPAGVKQFLYYKTLTGLLFSSSATAILAVLPALPPPNTALLQDILAGSLDRWVYETEFEHIHQLPPAFLLHASPEKIVQTRYWTYGQAAQPLYKNDAEYGEHFRRLFEDAVRARLRASTPVAVFGGGGLDSASIACVAERLLVSGDAPGPVYGYSAVFDHAPAADERTYLEKTIRQCPHIPYAQVLCDDCWAMRQPAGCLPPGPDRMFLDFGDGQMQRLQVHACQAGCRVALMGSSGDDVAGQWPYYIPACLRDIPLRRLPVEAPFFRAKIPHQPLWKSLLYAYLRPLIPAPLRALRARWRGDRPLAFRPPPGVASDNPLFQPPLPTATAAQMHAELTDGACCANLAVLEKTGAALGIEYRFPYLDRSLIDFVLRLPVHLFIRRGVNRYIQRQAMHGILPDELLQRAGKAAFGELVDLGLRDKEKSRIQHLLGDSRLVQSGLIPAARLSQAWAAYWQGAEYAVSIHTLMRALCIEMWLRQYDDAVKSS